MQVLALRMKANNISLIVFLSITRYLNKEVDFVSQIFRDSKSCPLSLYKFVQLFNLAFKPKILCIEILISSKIAYRLISEVQISPSKIES